MALKFGDTKGKAIKKSFESYTYNDGDNSVRLVGGVMPRYVYWLKGTNNKDIPLECLAFNRETEKFDNAEMDYVPVYHPTLRCQWAYSINCIDPKDGKVKILNLKKKLFEQIITAAEDLGDPTDPETGWDVVFKRSKNGPHTFNVEYTLSVLKCKKRALNETELAAIEASQDIDTKFPRPTPDEIKAMLEKLKNAASAEDSGEEVPEEAADL